MEYRRFGRSGLQLSLAGLGCNNFGGRLDEQRSIAVVQAALDSGVTHFDTADIYADGRSEQILGAALRGVRDQVVIGTKFGNPTGPHPYDRGGSRRYVRRAVEASLTRLGTDYIDICYLHSPDPLTPIEETLSALHDLVGEGKLRYLAASSMPGWQLARAAHTADERGFDRFEATQDEWSLVSRDVERDVVPACEAYGISVIPFVPLAGGLLTGKYQEGRAFPEGSRFAQADYFARMATTERFRVVRALQQCADETGRSPVELALGWLVSHDVVVSVPVGASSPEQATSNTAATRPLPADELALLRAALDDLGHAAA